MNQLDRRIEADLGHIADRATPSPTAWESIQDRIAEQVDHPEPEITMLKPNPNPSRRNRTWMLGAAAATLLALGALYVTTSGGEFTPLEVTDADEPAPSATPTVTAEPPPTTTSAPPSAEVSPAALATIEEFLSSTDIDAVNAVVTKSAIADSTQSALAIDTDGWLVSRQLLGLEVQLLSCLEAGSETSARCQVSIRSSISEALGQDPRLRGVTFDFSDGLISTWPAVITGTDFDRTREIAAAAGLGDELDAACGSLSTECAEFVMANLDALAAAASASQ